jgi:hypothetical protein
VKISVDGWTMPPFMGLASWAAFTQGKMGDAMVMGDTVLFQDEVNPVMSAALDNGFRHGAAKPFFTTSRRFISCTSAAKVPLISSPQPSVKFGTAWKSAPATTTNDNVRRRTASCSKLDYWQNH